MKNLFFGGSSEIAIKIAKKIKNTNNISRSKSKVYLKNYLIKNYNSDNIKKILKIINNKFDNIVIFNGAFSGSFLTNYEEKEFNRIFTLNFKIPMLIAQLSLKQKIINKNGAIFFISSVAAETDDPGNAYYSIAKNSLNFGAKILGKEQRKRGIRINVISLGTVKNKMGSTALKIIANNRKKIIYKNNKFINKIIKLLKNKNLNRKKIIIR